MRSASTLSTLPSRRARTVTPESRPTVFSRPVPTSGASVLSSGTAWRCMFEPIRARLASSFSKNGISEAATDTNWLGDTSMYWTSSGRTTVNSPPIRAETESLGITSVGVQRGIGLRDYLVFLVERRQINDAVGDP